MMGLSRLQGFVLVAIAVSMACVVNLWQGRQSILNTSAWTKTSASTVKETRAFYQSTTDPQRRHLQNKQEYNYDDDKQDDSQSAPPPSSSSFSTIKSGDTFAPGTLPLSRLETFAKCHIDTERYKEHITRQGCSVSSTYNLTYHLVSKSASSTGRTIMKETFNATESPCLKTQLGEKSSNTSSQFHFTITRDPFSRFFASFDEMLLRYVMRRESKQKFILPDQYRKGLVPYRQMTHAGQLKRLPSQRVKDSFVQFVQDYDAAYPFDGHLRLQVPFLVDMTTGRPNARIQAILDTATLDEEWAALADQVGAPRPTIIQARNRSRRFNTTELASETVRKICQLQALDFCCLNYALPEVCRDVIHCRWTEDQRIQPVSPYPPLFSLKDEEPRRFS